MKAIFLDGYLAGEVRMIPRPLDPYRVAKPAAVTLCDCNPAGVERFESQASIIEYKLTSVSIDREVALYTTDGNLFEALTKRRDWIAFDKLIKGPLYWGCHDERAWK